MPTVSKAERSRALRYKKPALATMGWEAIRQELDDIQEACSDVHWYFDTDDDTLINALDGDEEEAWEFKLAFADLEGKADQLSEILYDYESTEVFDDCTVALIGNRYDVVGFDSVEEDYYSLCRYEADLAVTESGKRLMRLTKAEMLSTIGQSVGVLLAFYDLRQQYDYLKATMDILRDQNKSLLQVIKEIDGAYEAAEAENFYNWKPETKRLDRLLEQLPERTWIE